MILFNFSRRYIIYKIYRWKKTRILYSLNNNYTSKTTIKNMNKSNSLDFYNEHLLQEKCNKWNDYLFRISLIKPEFCNKSRVDRKNKLEFEEFTDEKLFSNMLDYIRENDINNVLIILEIFKEKSYVLSRGLMVFLLKLFAKIGQKEGFYLMVDYYKDFYKSDYEKMNQFKYYYAQLLWYCGNHECSLNIIEDCYKNNICLKHVNYILYDIVSHIVNSHSEVSLVLIINFIKKILFNHEHHYPMTVLWKALIESDWFVDQQLSCTLVNENGELFISVAHIIPIWCAQYIKCNKIEVVSRFCELLLLHNCLTQYSSIMHDLFDHYYYQRNLKKCSSIVKSLIYLNIPMKETYEKRFIVLLTTGKPDKGNKIKIPKTIEYQINLKF